MQASEPPQMRSASAMVQASRGGLEKYPNAGSRDHAQYCASSKNKSTVENVRPARRMTVRMAMSATAKPRLGSRTRDCSLVSDTEVIIHPARERRLNQALVVRFRSSHHFAAHSRANFGIQGPLATL